MPLTAEQRRDRARLAADTRHHPGVDPAELERQRNDAAIDEILARAPTMTAEQAARVGRAFTYIDPAGPHLDYEPDYEPGGTERPGIPRAVAMPPGIPPRAAPGQPECGARASDGHVCSAAPHAGDHAAYEMSTGGDHLLRTWPRGAAWLPTEAELAEAPEATRCQVHATILIHLRDDGPHHVAHYDGRPGSRPWSVIHLGDGAAEARLFASTAAQCDALIAAATEARAHVTGGESGV